MKFMVLVIPAGYATAAPGTLPDEDHIAKMMAFNEEMVGAGIMLDGNGLHPPSMGARLMFSEAETQIINGPFPGVNEVLGGYWIVELPSLDAAKIWFQRCPMLPGDILEIRQLQVPEDFGDNHQS